MPKPILQAFVRGNELIVESRQLDEFGQPSGILSRRAPVSTALRAALDAQIDELDAEQARVESDARAEIAAGKTLAARPVADLIAKAESAKTKPKEAKS
jgi:hypothetical protein